MYVFAAIPMATLTSLAMVVEPSLVLPCLASGLIVYGLHVCGFYVRVAALRTNCSTRFIDFIKRKLGRDHRPVGALVVATHRGFAMIDRQNAWEGHGIFHRSYHHNQDFLLSCITEIAGGVNWLRRRSLETYLLAVLRQKASRGRLSDLSSSPHREIQLWVGAIACGIHGDKDTTPLADLALSDFHAGEIVYRLPQGALLPKMFQLHRNYFEQLLDGNVMISAGETAGSVLVKRLPKLPTVIRYKDCKKQGVGNIALGVDRLTGEPILLPFRDMMHTQIAGVSGYGKSTFLQSLIKQCLELGDELEQIVMIDLKGTDFNGFSCDRFEVFFEYEKITQLVGELVEEMEHRLTVMRKDGLTNWDGGRFLIIIDEFAQLIYQSADPRLQKAERDMYKAIQAKMIDDLCRLGMLGRAAGMTLVCATQKPTADAIPSALRTNLDAAIIFRSAKLLASTILPLGIDDLIFPSQELPKGCAIAWLNGNVRYLQSYVV